MEKLAETSPENPASGGPPSTDPRPDFASIRVGLIPGEGDAPGTGIIGEAVSGTAENDGGSSPEEIAPAMMTKDQFFDVFRALMGLPNVVLMVKKTEPLDAFKIPADDASARAASDALYETCEDVPWLHWMIQPEGKWMQRAFVIGSFFAGTAQNAAAELGERSKAARIAAKATRDSAGPDTVAENAPAQPVGDDPETDPDPVEPDPDPVVIDGVNYDGEIAAEAVT